MSKAIGVLRSGERVEIHSVTGDYSVIHDLDDTNYREVSKFDFEDAWVCGCVLPEQHCDSCVAKAREVYGSEDEIPWR